MTKQSDIKKLAEQMSSSMNSFDDIKNFQKAAKLSQILFNCLLLIIH